MFQFNNFKKPPSVTPFTPFTSINPINFTTSNSTLINDKFNEIVFLPNEILFMIADFLPIEDLTSLQQTNKFFYEFLTNLQSSIILWKKFIFNFYDVILLPEIDPFDLNSNYNLNSSLFDKYYYGSKNHLGLCRNSINTIHFNNTSATNFLNTNPGYDKFITNSLYSDEKIETQDGVNNIRHENEIENEEELSLIDQYNNLNHLNEMELDNEAHIHQKNGILYEPASFKKTGGFLLWKDPKFQKNCAPTIYNKIFESNNSILVKNLAWKIYNARHDIKYDLFTDPYIKEMSNRIFELKFLCNTLIDGIQAVSSEDHSTQRALFTRILNPNIYYSSKGSPSAYTDDWIQYSLKLCPRCEKSSIIVTIINRIVFKNYFAHWYQNEGLFPPTTIDIEIIQPLTKCILYRSKQVKIDRHFKTQIIDLNPPVLIVNDLKTNDEKFKLLIQLNLRAKSQIEPNTSSYFVCIDLFDIRGKTITIPVNNDINNLKANNQYRYMNKIDFLADLITNTEEKKKISEVNRMIRDRLGQNR